MIEVILTRENAHLYRNSLFLWNLEKYTKQEPKFTGFRDIVSSPNEYVFLKEIDEVNVYILTFTNFLKKKYDLVPLPKIAVDELQFPEMNTLLNYLKKMETDIENSKSDDYLDRLGRIQLIRIIAEQK